MNQKNRIKKLEDKVNPPGGLAIFRARGTEAEREASFERQRQEYLANGGNPDSLFILITDYFGPEPQTEEDSEG